MAKATETRPGYKLVYCRFTKRKGKIIYPRNGKVFRFWVKA